VVDGCSPRAGIPTLAETCPTLASELRCIIGEDPLQEPPLQKTSHSKRGAMTPWVAFGIQKVYPLLSI
jgi:hypothetical protein